MFLIRKLRYLRSVNFVLRQNSSAIQNQFLANCLNKRSLLRVNGTDIDIYLQGLITNDMKHLKEGALNMYALFLNSKGRVLYDSIIYNTGNENTYLIDCDTEALPLLSEHLLKYKVKRKINVDSVEDEYDIWSVVSKESFENSEAIADYKNLTEQLKQSGSKFFVAPDPRLSSLGLRVITQKDSNFCIEIKNKTGIEVKEENFYRLLRYKLGIGEGLRELSYEKSFPMETNADYLHGVSFHKGCYIGQELTARTYHTGVTRKRLMPLVAAEPMRISENETEIFLPLQFDKPIGKLKGMEQNFGIGVLRINEALKHDDLMILSVKCRTHKPFWWPYEAPKARMNIGQ